MDFSSDDDRASLFQVRKHFIVLLTPNGNAPPDGVFGLAFARTACDAQGSHFFAARREACFRVGSQVSCDMDEIHDFPLLLYGCLLMAIISV